MIFYTDGIPESFDPAGEAYGTDRLDEACRQAAPSAQALIERVLADVNHFTQNAPLTDDRTIVALTIR